jgi:hypothetical protein
VLASERSEPVSFRAGVRRDEAGFLERAERGAKKRRPASRVVDPAAALTMPLPSPLLLGPQHSSMLEAMIPRIPPMPASQPPTRNPRHARMPASKAPTEAHFAEFTAALSWGLLHIVDRLF